MEDVIHRCCAGLDIGKKIVVACVRRLTDNDRVVKKTRTFGTVTRELLALADWLVSEEVSSVAMESTGVYWKPIFNILEDRFEVVLANARDLKNVPGRKTDVKDSEWIAQLHQYGLLRPSFIPPRPQRELRDLTRHRTQVVGETSRVRNRIQKVLEDANIKLSSVASDTVGVSGRKMIEAIIKGETDRKKLAELARGRLREKIPQLEVALEGHITDHHRYMLKTLMEHLKSLEEIIDSLTQRIEEVLRPNQEAMDLVKTVPGLQDRSVQSILAEIGTDMSRFRTDAHIASWAGICPGNNESAGKHKSGKIRKGSRWLRSVLVQTAWAASRTKGTYFQAQYHRLAGRRGKKRAIVAVAHSILVVVYHILKNKKPYSELGADYFDRLDPEALIKRLVKRLEKLGHKVTLEAGDKVA